MRKRFKNNFEMTFRNNVIDLSHTNNVSPNVLFENFWYSEFDEHITQTTHKRNNTSALRYTLIPCYVSVCFNKLLHAFAFKSR